MNKILKLVVVVAMPLVMLGSCASKTGNQENVDTLDSVDVTETEEIVLPQLTQRGVVPVITGMSVDSIPLLSEGLYDEVRTAQDTEKGCTVYTFNKEGEEMFVARSFGSGRIDVVSLETPVLSAMIGDIVIRCGESVDNVLRLNGVHPELIDTENGSFWAWKGGEFWIMLDEQSCGEKAALLYDVKSAPDADELGHDSKIGYIGTGLPF